MASVRIIDLDRRNLAGALALAAEVFDDSPSMPISLLASLGVPEVSSHPYLKGVPWRRYWVAVLQDGPTEVVVGVVGLYLRLEDQADAAWVNWFAVSPQHRRHGIGWKLLDHAIHATYQLNKPFLRLWTSNQSRERGAQFLYERMGFLEIGRKRMSGYLLAKEITRECEVEQYAMRQDSVARAARVNGYASGIVAHPSDRCRWFDERATAREEVVTVPELADT